VTAASEVTAASASVEGREGAEPLAHIISSDLALAASEREGERDGKGQ
jgi:hypothetical protein